MTLAQSWPPSLRVSRCSCTWCWSGSGPSWPQGPSPATRTGRIWQRWELRGSGL